jgi:hypothetical protein
MQERPEFKVAEACRSAAIEMPRPTVRKWCEHGYEQAFLRATRDVGALFRGSTDNEVLWERSDSGTSGRGVLSGRFNETAAVSIPEAQSSATEALEERNVDLFLGGERIVLRLGGSGGEKTAEEAVVAECSKRSNQRMADCIGELLPQAMALE